MNIYEKACLEMTIRLVAENIKFEYTPAMEGGMFRFMNGTDAVCHKFSYGAEQGLFETMGFAEDKGDVTGYLTINEVISRLKRI